MRQKQLEGRTRVISLEDGTLFIPIPEDFIKRLNLKEGDSVYINETEIWEGDRELIGFTISKVEDE